LINCCRTNAIGSKWGVKELIDINQSQKELYEGFEKRLISKDT
jgi:hypothetical protein